jgi:PhnB protein
MHARLVLGDQVLMGCDVAVQVGSADKAERLFVALAEGGTVQMPIGESFWAVRFGVPWWFICEKAAGA